ncbi:glycerophosphoryl diester phosphodiesterase membrane domain-containing protein [Streptomyces sp. NPDC023838]|uniref:glycerophosphoryl diester phosphodiesterase membrane domain-containing protein n=1 Tax=Streptomyces sp. NPDC023838 TaxID=3154325 RepID=UPI0033EEFAB8
MNDSPGWASPGSAPSDGEDSGTPRQPEPSDRACASSQWSRNQPPAGQWSPPAATPGQGTPPPPPGRPGPQQGGWGPPPAPGGQWNSGWGPAPAAKPGVIPLRPLGVGEILDGAVSTMRAHWRTVLGLTLTVAVITQIADILVQRYLLPDPPEIDPNATGTEALDQAIDSLRSSMLYLLPIGVVALIGTVFVTAVLTVVISRSVLGRPVTLREAWADARPRLLPLLGLLALLPLTAAAVVGIGILPGALIGSDAGAALAGLGGLAAFVVVIWLLVRFSLAAPALMLERQSLVKSLRRSAKLVRGAWWRIFGITLLTLLLTFIVSMIIAIPFTVIGTLVDDGGASSLFSGASSDFGWPFLIITGIGAVIGSAITYPISAGVAALLYIDQRIRREALDLDLARAANLPGYETPGS